MSGVEDNVALTGIWQPSGPEKRMKAAEGDKK